MKYEINDEVLIERLIERMENGNTFILKTIGKTIAEIKKLKLLDYTFSENFILKAFDELNKQKCGRFDNLNNKNLINYIFE